MIKDWCCPDKCRKVYWWSHWKEFDNRIEYYKEVIKVCNLNLKEEDHKFWKDARGQARSQIKYLSRDEQLKLEW